MGNKGENKIRSVKLLHLKKKYRFMTGGSRSRFLVCFALGQLKSNRKSGLNNKLPSKPGNRWTITYIGQKANSPLEDDVKEGISEESDSEENIEEEEEVEDYSDSFDSYESSSCGDTDENSAWIPPRDRTFSFGLRNQFSDDRNTLLYTGHPAATSSAQCSLETREKFTLETLRSLGLRSFFKMIEEHVSTCSCYNHAPLKDLVLRGPLDGTTPLVLACHHGDLEMVMYLVEKWGVCVNDTAVYYPKGNFKRNYKSRSWKIQGASPVFVASFKRKINIVEYLIRKRADLNLKTTSRRKLLRNLTPLLGALRQYNAGSWYIYAEPLDIGTIVIPLVRLLLENGAHPPTLQNGYPIWTGIVSSSVNLTTLLVHHGMALDQKDNRHKMTVLHYWANLENTKSEEDSLAVVKLCVEMGANLKIRDKKGNTPILTAVKSRNWTIVDFLVDNDRLDRTEKIDGLELVAATILSESNEYDSHVKRAFGYLRRAFLLREENPDPILKTPLTLESGRTIEWTTIAEVEAGIQNPKEYKIQAYLTLLRISPDRRSSLYFCFSDLLKQRRFDDIHDVLWATLDIFPGVNGKIQVIGHLVSMMSQLKNNHHLFTAETFKKPLECLLATELSYWASYNENILLEFVAFLARNAKFLIDEDIKESLRNLVAQENRINREFREPTMLHKASYDPEYLSAIRLLLLSGANPNADHYDGGPLHVLATQYRRWLVIDADIVDNAARLLLNYGADLCKVNKKRETAADVWRRYNGGLKDLPDWLREEKVKKLSCQSARVITSRNIPYDEDELPANLHLFVEAHRHPS